jgi:sugar lactone lactonase YvrE
VKRFAAAIVLTCAPALAHSIADVALVSRVPEFVPRGNASVELVVDVRAYDPAYGLVVTIDAAGGTQIVAVSGESAFRCDRQSRRVRCSAEELTAGPHVLKLDISASDATVQLTANVETIGSTDPAPANNALTVSSRTYAASSCQQQAPIVSVNGGDVTWTSVAGATIYEVLSGVDGEALRIFAATTETRVTAASPGGDVTFAVRARFADCPLRTSVPVSVTSTGRPQGMQLSAVSQTTLRQPVAIAALANEILAADAATKTLFSLNRATGQLAAEPVYGDIVEVPPAFDGGIAEGPGGYLYIVDRANHAVRLAFPPPRYVYLVAGRFRQSGNVDAISTNARFNSPTAIVVDGSSTIYVSDTGNRSIRRIRYDAAKFDFAVSTVTSALNEPVGIALTPEGDLIVADRGDDTVKRVSPAGAVSTIASGLNDPYGVAVDDRGNIYVAETGSGEVRKIAPNGRMTTVISGLMRPGLIAAASDGSLWIPDQATGQLFHATPATFDRKRSVRR